MILLLVIVIASDVYPLLIGFAHRSTVLANILLGPDTNPPTILGIYPLTCIRCDS